MPRVYQPDLTCPACGFEGELHEFDGGMACEGCVFCNECSCEFDTVTGKEHCTNKCCEEVQYTLLEKTSGEYVEQCVKIQEWDKCQK